MFGDFPSSHVKALLPISPILMLLIAGEPKGNVGIYSVSSPDKSALAKLMQWSMLDRTRSSMLMQHMMEFLCLCRWGR